MRLSKRQEELQKLIKEQRNDMWLDKVQSLASKPLSFRSKNRSLGNMGRMSSKVGRGVSKKAYRHR